MAKISANPSSPGAGNIGKEEDGHVYVDGDIVREGHPGESVQPDYSAGRGGRGNINHADRTGVPSEEIVPEVATRHPGAAYDDYHTGRGGEGNVHREKFGGHSHAQKERPENSVHGLIEKAKHAVGFDKKDKTPEPTQ